MCLFSRFSILLFISYNIPQVALFVKRFFQKNLRGKLACGVLQLLCQVTLPAHQSMHTGQRGLDQIAGHRGRSSFNPPVVKSVGILLRLTVIDLYTQHTSVAPPKGACHLVSHTPSVRLGGGTKVLAVRVVGEGAAPDTVFDCHCYNITQKGGLVKGKVVHR